MSQAILSQKTQSNLGTLKKEGLLDDFYLAGGTGLALQLKHRKSIDLDFFTKNDIDTNSLIQDLKELGSLTVENEAKNTLEVNFEETRITFLNYGYPLLYDLKTIKGIEVADYRDIGCMKISAVSSRDSKKDFIDLFFIAKKLELSTLLELFEEKYAGVDYNMTHILKSLTFFKQAEGESMPEMLEETEWQEVKKFFEEEVPKLNAT